MIKICSTLFVFLFYNITFSQTLNFYGNVKDKISNQPISGASIEIINIDNGLKYNTQSAENGNWSFITDVESNRSVPFQFSLDQNYPNPFNPSTRIGFSVHKEGDVILRVYNILGQELDRKSFHLNAGIYSIEWYSKGSSSVLFYSIEMNGIRLSKKMVQIDGGNGGFGSLLMLGSAPLQKISGEKFEKNNLTSYKVFVSKLGYMPDSTTFSTQIQTAINFNLETVHNSALLFDLHNDVLEATVGQNYEWSSRHTTTHTDIPRMNEGGLDAQMFSVWVNPTKDSNYYNKAISLINTFNQQINLNSSKIGQARNEAEVINLNSQQKIAAVLGLEGGHHIENDISKLINFYNLGVRYFTITWNNSTSWAVSASDFSSKTWGLSDFGKQIIRVLDSLGIIIDISHVGIKTIEDILSITKNPIIASHSGVYNIRQNSRNLTDDQIKAIASKGGVIGIVFYPTFLCKSNANVDSVVKHVDYIVKLVGVDYVAVGSDFDGIEITPTGLEDVSKFPNFTLALLKKGYSIMDVKKILGENYLRVFKKVCR